jgi:predicted small secreted protein
MKKPFALIAAAAFVAGCQTTDMNATGGAGSQARPAASQSAVPLMAPVTLSESSDTDRSVSRAADGTVRTRETTTSASVSVDPGALLGAVLGAAVAGSVPTQVTPADMAGNWTLVQPDGKSCTVTLRTFGNTPGGALGKSGCFHDAVFSAMNWELRPGQIVLTSAVRDPVASLALSGTNRARGAGMTLYR